MRAWIFALLLATFATTSAGVGHADGDDRLGLEKVPKSAVGLVMGKGPIPSYTNPLLAMAIGIDGIASSIAIYASATNASPSAPLRARWRSDANAVLTALDRAAERLDGHDAARAKRLRERRPSLAAALEPLRESDPLTRAATTALVAPLLQQRNGISSIAKPVVPHYEPLVALLSLRTELGRMRLYTQGEGVCDKCWPKLSTLRSRADAKLRPGASAAAKKKLAVLASALAEAAKSNSKARVLKSVATADAALVAVARER